VHAVDPIGVERLNPIDHVSDRLIVGEDPDLAVVLAHHAAEVLDHDGWLITGWMKRSEGNTLLVVSSNSIIEPQR